MANGIARYAGFGIAFWHAGCSDATAGMRASSSRLRVAIHLLGETLREIGVLALVFTPLDSLVSGALTPSLVAATIVAASVLIAIGLLLEVLTT